MDSNDVWNERPPSDEDISAPGVCVCGTEIPSGVRYCSQSCRNTDRMFHRQEAAPEPTLEHRVTSRRSK